MKKFDSSELKILKGSFSAIGWSIPSSRSKTGHISTVYVRMVLTGRVNRDNETTREIFSKAEKILETLKA